MKQILLKPVLTEKSMNLIPVNKYTFDVLRKTNKIEITKTIKEIYKVDPIKVNIINIKSRIKKFRTRYLGKTRAWKKAIITLKKGQKIPEFEIKE